MKRAIILVGCAGVLSGCASHVLLRDPQTGQVVNCTAQAQVNANPITRVLEESRCARSYKAAGFACIQGDCR